MAEEGKGKLVTIGIWVFLAGLAVYLIYAYVLNAPPDPKTAAQLDPEGALKAYLKAAYDFEHSANGGLFDVVQVAVTEDDWNWWKDNYQNLHFDPLSLSSGIDPHQADAIAKYSTLRGILMAGADHPGNQIVSRDVGAGEATFVVRKIDGQSKTQTDIKVKLVKVKKLWKVAGFAGGRAVVEGKIQPGDFETTELPSNQPGDKTKTAAKAEGEKTETANENEGKPAPKPEGEKPPPPKTSAGAAGDTAAAPKPAAAGDSSATSAADVLIEQAGKDWEAKNYRDSIANAQRALAIYKRKLGESDPKVAQVQQMIDAAQKAEKEAEAGAK